jgi:hypothetical protein
VNMIFLKMNMCLYDVVILILYMRSYFLYVERISHPPMAVGRLHPRGVDVKVEDA